LKDKQGETKMRQLHKHHIVDLFVWVDDILPETRKAGAKSILKDSELITILIWDGLTESHQNLREIYSWIMREYQDCFPKMPAYQNFVAHCHRSTPILIALLESTMSTHTPLRFMDSTMLPVCRTCRADRHKVAKSIADFGKNHQGWWYGFKMHTAIDHHNNLCAVYFTPANVHDAQAIPKLVNNETTVAVGDGGYNASVMRERIWRKYGCFVLAPPHYKQNKKIATEFQIMLLKLRPKIEATFSILKEKMHRRCTWLRLIPGVREATLCITLEYCLATS
jgi:hypothetical protein